MGRQRKSWKEAPGESEALATIAIHSPCTAVKAIAELLPDASSKTLLNEIVDANLRIAKGDLLDAEQMLFNQALILQAVFAKYIKRTSEADHIDHLEAFAKIALRAQNQCQRTLRTLLEYKNPKRATFIKQQNNTLNQQINPVEQKTEKEINSANELLEVNNGTRMDSGTAAEAGRSNPHLAAVGTVNRAKIA